MIVTLTPEQMQEAEQVGLMRRQANRKAGTQDHKTPRLDGNQVDITGAAGELAAHLATGAEWTGRYVPPEQRATWANQSFPDLGDDIEVRTCTQPWHNLLVRKADPPNWRFVHVIQHSPTKYEVYGWAYGHEAQKDPYWRPNLPYPAYAYPPKQLRPMETFNRKETT